VTTAIATSTALATEFQAKRCPTEVNQKSALTAPIAKRTCPQRSLPSFSAACRWVFGRRESRHAANAMSGRLAMKSHRQLTCDTTMPPTTGPPMLAEVNTVAK